MKVMIPSGASAQLMTLQGNNSGRQVRLVRIIERGYMTPAESNNYPELMGIIPIIGAIAAAVPAIATGIGGLIKTWNEGKQTSAQNTILQQQLQLEAARSEQMKTLLMIGVPAAIVLVLILSRRK